MNLERAYLLEDEINRQRDALRRQHLDDLKEMKYKPKSGALYSELFSLNERMGDYIINVSETIREYQEP